MACKERNDMSPANERQQSCAEEKKLHPSEHDETPPGSQLWNAIEFSAKFPELTMQLVSSLKTAETEHAHGSGTAASAAEQLEFPILEAPDPRKLREQLRKKHAESAAQTREAELELFTADQLESAATPLPSVGQKKRGQAWAYILTAVFLFSLLWIYGLAGIGRQPDVAQTKAQRTTLKKEAEELHLQARK